MLVDGPEDFDVAMGLVEQIWLAGLSEPDRSGPRAVRFYAALALEQLTGRDFGAARAKTEAEWLGAVKRAQDWAARR